MKRTEILNIRLKELEEQRDKLKKKLTDLYGEKQAKHIIILKDWFNPLSEEDKDITLNFQNSYIDVITKVKGKEDKLFTLRIRGGWVDGDTIYSGIELSKFSTGSIVDEDVVKEFFLTAKWSQFVLDHQDDIIAELNLVQDKYNKERRVITDQLSPLEESIRTQREDIDKLRREDREEKLKKEGVVLQKSNRGWLPSFEYKHDRYIYDLFKMKLLSKTKSGLSATLEVTTRRVVDDEYKFYTRILENVRMDKIDRFLQRYTAL